MPPMKKLIIMLKRKLIERVRIALCSLSLKKNSWDNSIPKSVNNPVKWVVLTTDFDIDVTNEFCNPIANNNAHTMIFGFFIIYSSLSSPIVVSIFRTRRRKVPAMQIWVKWVVWCNPPLYLLGFTRKAERKFGFCFYAPKLYV